MCYDDCYVVVFLVPARRFIPGSAPVALPFNKIPTYSMSGLWITKRRDCAAAGSPSGKFYDVPGNVADHNFIAILATAFKM